MEKVLGTIFRRWHRLWKQYQRNVEIESHVGKLGSTVWVNSKLLSRFLPTFWVNFVRFSCFFFQTKGFEDRKTVVWLFVPKQNDRLPSSCIFYSASIQAVFLLHIGWTSCGTFIISFSIYIENTLILRVPTMFFLCCRLRKRHCFLKGYDLCQLTTPLSCHLLSNTHWIFVFVKPDLLIEMSELMIYVTDRIFIKKKLLPTLIHNFLPWVRDIPNRQTLFGNLFWFGSIHLRISTRIWQI